MAEQNLAQAKEEALKGKAVGDHTTYRGVLHMVMEQNGRRYLMPITRMLPEAA